MNIFLTSLVVFLGIHYLGFGLSWSLLRLPSDRVVCFAPALALCYLAIASWWAYRFGYRLNGMTACVIVAPPFGLSTYVLAREWRNRPRLIPLLGRQLALFGAIWLVAVVVLETPLFFAKDAIVLTYGNNDIAHHTAISRFLLEQSRNQLTGFPAQYPHAFLWFADNTFFGYYSFVANVAALSGRPPYAVVSAVIAAVAALNTGMIFLLLRRILGLKKSWARLWSVLGAANALVLFIVYEGFGGQVFGTFLGLALLYLLVTETHPDRNPAGLLPQAAALGLLMAGLMLCYPHMLPFVLAFAGAWRLAIGLQNGNFRWLAGWILNGAVAALVCGLVIPNRLLGFYVWVRQAASDQSGWPIHFLWPDFLLGLVGSQMDQAHVALAQNNVRFPALAGLAAMLAYSLWLRTRTGRPRLLATLAAMGAIYACALFFAFTNEGEVFGGYKAFKLLSYFSAISLLIVAAGWARIWRQSAVGRIAAGVFLAGFLALWSQGIVTMVRGDGRGNVLPVESQKVATLDRDGKFASVNIVTENYWTSMWLAYFFLDKQLYQAYPSYYPATALNGEVNFGGGTGGGSKFVVIKGAQDPQRMAGLMSFSASPRITCRLVSGWHGPESDREWMGANGSDAEIEITVLGPASGITAVVHLQPYLPANAYSALWNGDYVATDVTTDVFTLQLGNLRPGKNTLLLRSKLPPRAPGRGDNRPICFGLRQLELSISN
ncbi:MAG: hypothetical protein WDM96_18710 [Lacunisphaera sp.]